MQINYNKKCLIISNKEKLSAIDCINKRLKKNISSEERQFLTNLKDLI